jgi:hypothetical protein
MTTTIINDDPNDNPSFNAGSVARFEDISISTLNRRIREDRFPPPDFQHGPYRYWLRSTVLAARERRIAECAQERSQQHQAQFESAAANARAAQKRKRQAAAADSNSTA